MQRIHFLLLGLLVSLTIAAVAPSLPPTRIIAGNSSVVVVTNGVNSFTLTAGSTGTNSALLNGTNTFTGTNIFARATITNLTAGTFTTTGDSSLADSLFTVSSTSPSTGAGLWTSWYLRWGTGLYLNKPSDGVLAQGAIVGKGAQTNQIYHTYTDPSNHQRLALYALTNAVVMAAETAGTGADNLNVSLLPSGTGVVLANAPVRLKGYTVATLPAGTQGDTAFVTDAIAPTFLGALVGGGAIVTPVFYNGTAWVSH